LEWIDWLVVGASAAGLVIFFRAGFA